ncbi:YgaP family membrane protein [Halobaculum limi]|uniref:YgaP family membrane protein n=1 Tax=Halobaculum limi TaxID=3031916 RepID=UPI002406CCD1|nr:DUF2892 domain-containing protein [Halobaculum sp. YSMS11]
MEKNVGGYDRIARFVVGPVLIVVGGAALGGFLTLAAGTLGLVIAAIALLVGAVLTVTATTQKCPLNAAIGLNTYEKRAAQQSPPDDGKPSVK